MYVYVVMRSIQCRLYVISMGHMTYYRISGYPSRGSAPSVLTSSIMPFMYTPLFDASNSGRVICISFSRLGKYVVVGTNNCLTVWNIDKGTPLVDDLRMFSDPLSIAWISGLVFVVGCSDGSLFSLQVIPEELCHPMFIAE